MAQITLQGEGRRELGKGPSRRLRLEGKIPAVVYGHGEAAVSVSVVSKEVDKILHSETGYNTIFTLKVGNDSRNVLIRDFQLDPVQGNLIHADFQTVAMDEKMTFQVPVHVVGHSKGVVLGGVLDLVLREIEIECLPADVPDNIEIDVTDLEIGDSLRVNSLQLDASKLHLLSDPSLVILTIVPPHVEEEPEEEELAVEAEAEEPELIRKGKAEEGEQGPAEATEE